MPNAEFESERALAMAQIAQEQKRSREMIDGVKLPDPDGVAPSPAFQALLEEQRKEKESGKKK